MAVTLGAAGPSDARDVGDGIAACQELTVLQARVHDPIKPVHLVREAGDG